MNTPTPLLIEIDIPVPQDEDDEIDLVEFFANQIRDDDGELSGQLLEAFDLEVANSRAVTDDVEIDEVTVDGSEVAVSYTHTWSATFPCEDLNKLGQEHGTAIGVAKDGKWFFEVHVRSEPRSTLEEF